MAQTLTGRKRVRRHYGRIREVAQMPNLTTAAYHDDRDVVAIVVFFRIKLIQV